MISAKDEFFLERENIQELNRLIDHSDLSHEERERINLELITEQEFEELKKTLSDRELSPLEAARRGMTMSAKQINKAVKRAANG